MNEETTDIGEARAEPPSGLRNLGIGLFGLFVFFSVLLFKLPEARIQNLVIGYARVLFQSQGFSFSAEQVKLSLLFGPAVKFYNVEIRALDDSDELLKIPYARVSPRLSSLLGKNKSVSLSAELLGGALSGSAGGSADSFAADLALKNLDPGLSTLTKRYVMVNAHALLDGNVRIDYDSANPTKAMGNVDLTVKNIQLPEQVLYGFNIPSLKISRCAIAIPVAGGHADLKNFECGKSAGGGSDGDDIAGRLSGQVSLDRIFSNSRVSAQASFELSDRVKKAFPLLEAILAGAKAPDGSFHFHLNGVLGALEPVPGP